MKSSNGKEQGEIFRKNLQGFMKEMRISHNGLAKATGVSQKTVWSVCMSKTELPQDGLVHLSQLLA